MPVRFIPNRSGIRRLAGTQQMVTFLFHAAGKVIQKARDVAPEATDDYVNGLKAWAGVVEGKARGRAMGTDWKSAFIEFGTGEPGPTPAFAPLRRGADAAGFKLRGGHK